MSLYQHEATVAADMKQEQNRTTLAAIIGLPTGLAVSVGLPLYLAITGGPALMTFSITGFMAPGLLAMCQQSMRDDGKQFLTRLFGYMGMGLGIPLLPVWMGSAGPMLLLVSDDQDRGNFKSAESMNTFLSLVSGWSPLMPAFLKNAYKVIGAQCLFHAGQIEKALDIQEAVLAGVDSNYASNPSVQNYENVCLIAAECVEYSVLAGDLARAQRSWTRVSRILTTDVTPSKTSAYAFNALAESAMHLQDAQGAMRLAEVASVHFRQGGMTSRLVAGQIACTKARAHLALGNLQEAKSNAELALKEWCVYLTRTALLTVDAYHILGQVAMKQGELNVALEQLDMAASIINKRLGEQSPLFIAVLESYGPCLRQSGKTYEANQIEQKLAKLRTKTRVAAESSEAV